MIRSRAALAAFLLLAALPAPGGGAVLAQELTDVWKDPEFQKRFLGTYGVLGEVEPRLSPEERAQLEKIVPLMSSDLRAAARQLSGSTTPKSSALFDFTLGNIHFQLEELEQAEASYRAAVEKFPAFQRAHKNLGLVLVRGGKMAEAIRSFTRVVELGGGDALSYGLLGHAYAAQQDYLSAESAYRQAILLQSDSLDWKLGLARCLFKEQKYPEAAALCGELIGQHPDRGDLWTLQAGAYVGMKEPMKAAQNYEVLARMGKGTVDAMNALGDIYVNESLMDLAVRAYGRAIELDPGQEIARPLRAAEILASRGALDQARQLLARIRQVQAGAIDEAGKRRLLKLEARIAVSEGSDSQAAQVLEEIVALDPLDGEALMLLGQHYARAGDRERAVFYYERAESLEPFEADARVRHAQLLVGQQRYQDALPLLKRAQQIRPRDELARYVEQVERLARSR